MMFQSSVRSGIFPDVAPDGAELFFAVIFYKYAAPTALEKSWLTTFQNTLGSATAKQPESNNHHGPRKSNRPL
jgi:hypothetical protein